MTESLSPSGGVELIVQRCLSGRLRNAYPAGAHDIEIRADPPPPTGALTSLLAEAVRDVRKADPACRKIVYAARAGDLAAIAAAEAAGFRYVVDVDLPDAELSLLVAEPAWITKVEAGVEHLPGT